jgi:hypothetical protein
MREPNIFISLKSSLILKISRKSDIAQILEHIAYCRQMHDLAHFVSFLIVVMCPVSIVTALHTK